MCKLHVDVKKDKGTYRDFIGILVSVRASKAVESPVWGTRHRFNAGRVQLGRSQVRVSAVGLCSSTYACMILGMTRYAITLVAIPVENKM